MEMMFRKGDIMEEVGRIIKNAPIPKGMTPEEEETYREVLEEKWLEAQEAALPRYEEAVKAAKELGIAQNQWLEKAKERITEIRPNSEVLSLEINQWQPNPKAKQANAPGGASESSKVATYSGSASDESMDEETKREIRRIQNIMNMEISNEDKIKQLNRIEMDARRNIELEEAKIRDLKQR